MIFVQLYYFFVEGGAQARSGLENVDEYIISISVVPPKQQRVSIAASLWIQDILWMVFCFVYLF